MGIYVKDITSDPNFFGVETRHRDGFKEAVCPGCGGWIRIRNDYRGDRIVIRSIPHRPPCAHFESLLTQLADMV